MKRILVVEDDRDIREALTEVLSLEGYAVESARNGQEGIDHLLGCDDEKLPNLILLDLMMPVKDGVQFRVEQQADARLAAIPVIVMSADHRVEGRSNQMKVSTFLKKPVEIDLLLSAIEATCR